MWLALEDDDDMPEMLIWMFTSMGISGKAFQRGEDLLIWADNLEARHKDEALPELALLDIRLTGLMSGIEVASRLRKNPLMKDMAIVMMTAYRLRREEAEEVLALSGADKILYKPLPRKKELYAILKDVIRSRQQESEAQ
jgi:DNA-binding response OmpR family regulator